MNQVKTRLAALALLDRAINAIDDTELQGLLDKVTDELRGPFDQMIAMAAAETAEPIVMVRSAAQRGRMNGTLERLSLVLVDPCLDDCITELGEHSDNPSEEQLQSVIPGLIERHGLGTVRMMLASTIAGEAAAAVTCTKLLKHDEVVGLPAVVATPTVVRPTSTADEAVKQKRKDDKARKQVEARTRREQAERARRG